MLTSSGWRVAPHSSIFIVTTVSSVIVKSAVDQTILYSSAGYIVHQDGTTALAIEGIGVSCCSCSKTVRMKHTVNMQVQTCWFTDKNHRRTNTKIKQWDTLDIALDKYLCTRLNPWISKWCNLVAMGCLVDLWICRHRLIWFFLTKNPRCKLRWESDSTQLTTDIVQMMKCIFPSF